MIFSVMLTDDFQDGIPIRHRFDGTLFNLRKLQAKSKVQTEVLYEFLFADDMAKGTPTEEKMQKKYSSSILFMWQLWSYNQHQKDWGGISASTEKALQGAYHHSECSTIASGRQVHLPRKHIVWSCAHWWSMPGLPKLVQHLADYVEVFGIEMKSDLTQSWKTTEPLCCQHYY